MSTVFLNNFKVTAMFNLYTKQEKVSSSPLPAPGDEGSNTLEESLYVLEACSDSFFLPLPSEDLWDFFLFFTKILYIKSIGLGRGTPDSS